jgi:hypothetical protein
MALEGWHYGFQTGRGLAPQALIFMTMIMSGTVTRTAVPVAIISPRTIPFIPL